MLRHTQSFFNVFSRLQWWTQGSQLPSNTLMVMATSQLLLMPIEDKLWVCAEQSTYDISLTTQIGLGMYCVHLCQHICRYDNYEPQRQLCDLSPYWPPEEIFSNLRTPFPTQCFCHQTLYQQRSTYIWVIMLSLFSSDLHPNIKKTFATIHSGGNKAKGTIHYSMSHNDTDMYPSMAEG